MFDNKYKKAFKIINKSNNILLVTHNRPDGDALSSVAVMIELLNDLNKNYFAYCLDDPPHQFSFLPHMEKITSCKEKLIFENYDLIIALDCGSLSRTNLVQEIKNKKPGQFIIEFDHHPKVDDYADIEIRIPKASSTAEVLYYFLDANKLKISKNTANCILTGILTDTGNFLYPSTSSKTIKIASEMLIYGARFHLILENTQRNKSLNAIRLWGKAMSKLKINKKYNFAYSVLTREEISQSQATEEELEGISGFLSNLRNVNGLLLLREENGIIKGSLRTSSPNVDISALAKALGGGGHSKASGFTIKGQLIQQGNKWKII